MVTDIMCCCNSHVTNHVTLKENFYNPLFFPNDLSDRFEILHVHIALGSSKAKKPSVLWQTDIEAIFVVGVKPLGPYVWIET